MKKEWRKITFDKVGDKTLIYDRDGDLIGSITADGEEDIATLRLHTNYCSIRLEDNDLIQIVSYMEKAAYLRNPGFFTKINKEAK